MHDESSMPGLAPDGIPHRTITLVLLSLDEREALQRLLPDLPVQLFDRVLAIDGGSTDGTLALYEAEGIEALVQRARGRGEAFQLARDRVVTDDVVFFSVDGNEDPRDLARIRDGLAAGYDMVVAGRFVRRGSRTDLGDDPARLRQAGAIAFGLLARLIWRTGVWDATNGYRGFRMRALEALRLDTPGHEIEYQSTIRAAKLGLRVLELPTHELPRLAGERKPTAGTLALGWSTLRCLLRELVLGRRFASGAS